MFLIALLVFFFSPLFSLPICIIGICCSKKPFLYCILIALSLSLLALSFEPSSSYDLYRIFEKVSWLKELNFEQFLTLYANNLEFGFNFVLYILSVTFDEHYIPAIFSFIGYLIIFYIICDYSKIKNVNHFITAFVIIIFILLYQHMYLISGIRNFIAMIIFVGLLYIEKVKKKENTLTHILYIIPFLFHTSMIIFVLFRLLIELKSKIANKIVLVTSIIAFVAPTLILQVLKLFQGNSFIGNLYFKLSGYINADYKYYSFLILLAMFLQLILYLYLYHFVSKKGIDNKYYSYIKYILFLCVGVTLYNVLFDRILVMLSCLCVILLIDYLNEIKDISRYNKFLCYFVILLVSSFTFRNQIYNYYNDMEMAIKNISSNNVIEIINSVR